MKSALTVFSVTLRSLSALPTQGLHKLAGCWTKILPVTPPVNPQWPMIFSIISDDSFLIKSSENLRLRVMPELSQTPLYIRPGSSCQIALWHYPKCPCAMVVRCQVTLWQTCTIWSHSRPEWPCLRIGSTFVVGDYKPFRIRKNVIQVNMGFV